jgi:starvation-inducible DNA-binding protein
MYETTGDPHAMLIDALKVLLADEFTMYQKAAGFHLNVEGPDFQEYHDLFGNIYEDVLSAIDPTGENIRKLGAYAPFTHAAFMQLTTLMEGGQVTTDPRSMSADLYANNARILRTIAAAAALAAAANEQGIANFLADRDDMHKKWAWQLRASLAEEAQVLPQI